MSQHPINLHSTVHSPSSPTASVPPRFSPPEETQRAQRSRSFYAQYFFIAMATLYLVIAVVGFTPNYQDIARGLAKPHWILHVHGALMASWLVVFLAQSILATKGNLKLHKWLGLSSVALAVMVFLTVAVVAIHMMIAYRPPEGHVYFDLVLMTLNGMLVFGLFYTWGMLTRKSNPAAHKRLLLLGTQITLQAAIDRLHWLPTFGISYPYCYFIYMDLLLIPLCVYDLVTLRRIHRITWIGIAIYIAMQLEVRLLWASPTLHKFWYDHSHPYTEEMIEITLDDSQVSGLLGHYGSDEDNAIVSREGGKLYIQLSGEEREEAGALSDTRFFLKYNMGTFTFEKDAQGRVLAVNLARAVETRRFMKQK